MSHIEATSVIGIAPVPAFGALRHRDYRTYFLVGVLAMIADTIEHVISYWMIYQKFHSPSLAGFAVISHWFPSLILSVHAGALADRVDCRKLLQIAQGLFMITSLVWGVLFLTDALQVWHAVLVLLVHGIASVLFQPAQQLIIHDIVGSQHLPSAIRLNASSRNLAVLLGPAAGGALLLLLGPAWGLLANVLNYIPFTLLLAFIPYTGHVHEETQKQRQVGMMLGEAGQVFREASKDRRILLMVLLGGAAALFVGNAFQSQMPEYAHHFGTDKTGFAYSALLAANAAGALLGVLLLESTDYLKPGVRTAIICAVIWSILIGLFPMAPNYGIALTLLLLAGFFNITFSAMSQTLVQLLAPAPVRGRIVGLYNTASLGLRTGSGFTVGVFGSVVGIYWSLGLSASAVFLIALGLLIWDLAGGRAGGEGGP